MIPLLQGGKQIGSSVKFTRFFLLVDPSLAETENLHVALRVFQQALRKSFGAVKGGEAVFKPDSDGPAFNAFSSINETLKQITEAANAAMNYLNGEPSKPPTSGTA